MIFPIYLNLNLLFLILKVYFTAANFIEKLRFGLLNSWRSRIDDFLFLMNRDPQRDRKPLFSLHQLVLSDDDHVAKLSDLSRPLGVSELRKVVELVDASPVKMASELGDHFHRDDSAHFMLLECDFSQLAVDQRGLILEHL